MNKSTGCLVPALFLSLVFLGCDDFFSTSWGKPRNYSLNNISVDADNVNEWIEQAVGNPELADALARKIAEQIEDMEDGPEKAKLQAAGIQFAIESSKIGTAILAQAADIISALQDNPSEEELKKLLENIQNSGTAECSRAADSITAIVGNDIKNKNSGEIPEFNGAYAEEANPSDVGQAVLILMLVLVPDIDVDFQAQLADKGIEYDEQADRYKVVSGGADENALTLAAYLNLIAGDPGDKFDNNPITKGIKDAFR